jgi:hypothetical protein
MISCELLSTHAAHEAGCRTIVFLPDVFRRWTGNGVEVSGTWDREESGRVCKDFQRLAVEIR